MARKAKETISCEHFVWCLFRRGDVWYADGRQNRPNLGKHSLATRDRDQALEQLRRLDLHKAVELGRAKQTSAETCREIPIQRGWELCLENCARPDVLGGVGASTSKRYRAAKDKHLLFCDQHGIGSWNVIDETSVTEYGKWLSRKSYADATIYLELTLIKQVVKWMIEKAKLLPESHRIRLPLRRSHESDTYCYSREEVRALVEWCRAAPAMEWMADTIIALAATGMRISELAGLRWSDVDLVTAVITLSDNRHSGQAKKLGSVRTTKGRRTRRLPIHAELMNVLAKLARRADGRVFGGPRGGILKPDTVRNVLIREAIAALKEKFPTPKGEIGFEHGRLHSFRHFFVSQAFLGGASEGEIREWVGHRDSRIVERYRHLRSQDARRKMDKIDFLGNAASAASEPAAKNGDGNNVAQHAQ
jgi:integrase